MWGKSKIEDIVKEEQEEAQEKTFINPIVRDGSTSTSEDTIDQPLSQNMALLNKILDKSCKLSSNEKMAEILKCMEGLKEDILFQTKYMVKESESEQNKRIFERNTRSFKNNETFLISEDFSPVNTLNVMGANGYFKTKKSNHYDFPQTEFNGKKDKNTISIEDYLRQMKVWGVLGF